MEQEVKALLLLVSTELHDIEKRFLDEDLPEAVDKLWMDITLYLESAK